MEIAYLLLAAIAVSLVAAQVNLRLGSPVLAIFERWLRWLIFAFGAAHLCVEFHLIDRPFWALVTVFVLLWFLGDTLYNWLGIQALSVSPLPLFPRYVPSPGGEEWPVQPRLLRVREWLRGQGFRPVQALRAEIGNGLHLRVAVYQDAAAKIRIHITFLPQAGGAIAVCYSLISLTADGTRFVTDNFYIPFVSIRSTGTSSVCRCGVRCRACWPGTRRGSPARRRWRLPVIRWRISTRSSTSLISSTRVSVFSTRPPSARNSARSPRPAAIASGRKSGC